VITALTGTYVTSRAAIHYTRPPHRNFSKFPVVRPTLNILSLYPPSIITQFPSNGLRRFTSSTPNTLSLVVASHRLSTTLLQSHIIRFTYIYIFAPAVDPLVLPLQDGRDTSPSTTKGHKTDVFPRRSRYRTIPILYIVSLPSFSRFERNDWQSSLVLLPHLLVLQSPKFHLLLRLLLFLVHSQRRFRLEKLNESHRGMILLCLRLLKILLT
jgi:hypothetical protein